MKEMTQQFFLNFNIHHYFLTKLKPRKLTVKSESLKPEVNKSPNAIVLPCTLLYCRKEKVEQVYKHETYGKNRSGRRMTCANKKKLLSTYIYVKNKELKRLSAIFIKA